MSSSNGRFFVSPKCCRGIAEDQLSPKQRYCLQQSRRRYSQSEDGKRIYEMFVDWATKGEMQIGSYNGVLVHDDAMRGI